MELMKKIKHYKNEIAVAVLFLAGGATAVALAPSKKSDSAWRLGEEIEMKIVSISTDDLSPGLFNLKALGPDGAVVEITGMCSWRCEPSALRLGAKVGVAAWQKSGVPQSTASIFTNSAGVAGWEELWLGSPSSEPPTPATVVKFDAAGSWLVAKSEAGETLEMPVTCWAGCDQNKIQPGAEVLLGETGMGGAFVITDR